ncbi:MAG: hypothetical protein AVO35_03000 [Candidatus Aegiribacteria sp. MLS_C]|nr:MAG: hypothetical protein AVO35_03000 [Candidatus Aegiribacteria sp. MLS_C]
MKPIISGSGIRGVFGRSLTVSSALDFASAFGALCGGGPVVVGRDTRITGPAVQSAVFAGLMSAGCDPLDLGVVPTPTVQLEAMADGVSGGIAITSSHNPGEWNALKLIGPDGVFLRASARARFMDLLKGHRDHRDYRGAGRPGAVSGAMERHVDRILSLPGVAVRGRQLRVVLDVTGGTAAFFAPMLMEAMNVEYTVINASMGPDGDFPRQAEPTVESLQDLSSAVVDSGADLGFAFDPDGDRLAMVDGRGRIIGEDYTVALAIDHVLAFRPGPAVVNLSTSMLAEDAAARHGCSLYRSPVGEVNVVEEMELRGSTIGGEGNGGVIDRNFHPGRDSGIAMAYAVSMLRSGASVSIGSWADGFPDYSMMKRKVSIGGDFRRLGEGLVSRLGEPDDTRDGLWYRRSGGWTHIRPSGTEPVVRFIAEDLVGERIESEYGVFMEAVNDICVE